MIKVLGLALYGPLAASNRYRLGQYVPGLASMGVDLQICSLLGDDYLRASFGGRSLLRVGLFRSALARISELCHQHEYDVVILHCELFPFMPGWVERAFLRKPYIYDFDDAFYLKYLSGRFRIGHTILGRKFENVVQGAAAVTAGNHTLANFANQYNANVQYFPTVVDTERYLPKFANRGGQVLTVGWIGSPSTAPYLSELVGPLSLIGKEGPVRFVVIGGKAPAIPNVEVVEIDWNEKTEVDLINSFDIGVMPLPDADWTRGKCAFKLIQYMACEVPVIASKVGANINVVNVECGILASTPQEWTDALRLLRNEPSKRKKMGEEARKRIVQHFSLHQNLPVIADLIKNIARQLN
jgi:glycosyltransferase involved in cell wall biosynthesis